MAWLRESCGVAAKHFAQALVSEDLTGAESYAPGWLTHMAVSEHQEASVLAGCRKDMLGSSPCGPLYTLLDCPPNVAGKQRGMCCAFYELQVILHHVHSILLVKRK